MRVIALIDDKAVIRKILTRGVCGYRKPGQVVAPGRPPRIRSMRQSKSWPTTPSLTSPEFAARSASIRGTLCSQGRTDFPIFLALRRLGLRDPLPGFGILAEQH